MAKKTPNAFFSAARLVMCTLLFHATAFTQMPVLVWSFLFFSAHSHMKVNIVDGPRWVGSDILGNCVRTASYTGKRATHTKMPTHMSQLKTLTPDWTRKKGRCRRKNTINSINASLWYGKISHLNQISRAPSFANFVFIPWFTICVVGWKFAAWPQLNAIRIRLAFRAFANKNNKISELINRSLIAGANV